MKRNRLKRGSGKRKKRMKRYSILIYDRHDVTAKKMREVFNLTDKQVKEFLGIRGEEARIALEDGYYKDPLFEYTIKEM